MFFFCSEERGNALLFVHSLVNDHQCFGFSFIFLLFNSFQRLLWRDLIVRFKIALCWRLLIPIDLSVNFRT